MAMMKNSTAEWLGDIPVDWSVFQIGNYYELRNEKVSDVDFAPLSVTMKGIVPQLATAAKSDDHNNRKLVRKGDFAINSRSDRRGSCGISKYDGSVSLINTILTPRGKMEPRYYDWLFHTEQFADEFYKWGHGIVDDLWTTRWQEMKKILIVSPPLSEQQVIADYLDEKCSKIDDIIAESKASIEEYKELKQAVISEAVTKGLDKNVEMKDSGLEWIGKIPKNWSTIKIGNIFTLRKERNSLPEEKVQLLSLYTSIGVFPQGEHVTASGNHAQTVDGYKVVHKNDIVVNIILAWMGAIGVSDYDGVTSPAYDVYIPDLTKVVPRYFHYVFRTSGIAGECYKYGRGIMMMRWRTYSQEFKQIKVPFPSPQKQKEIAAYLDKKVTELDSLIAEKESLIKDLESYKKSLIYEVVTGKRRVV